MDGLIDDDDQQSESRGLKKGWLLVCGALTLRQLLPKLDFGRDLTHWVQLRAPYVLYYTLSLSHQAIQLTFTNMGFISHGMRWPIALRHCHGSSHRMRSLGSSAVTPSKINF